MDVTSNPLSWTSTNTYLPQLAARGVVVHSSPTPEAPDLLAPADGAVLDSAKPTFEWSDVFGSSEGTYRLQVSGDDSHSEPLIDVSALAACSYIPTADIAEGTYWWRVRAVDNTSGEGAWSDGWSFTVETSSDNGGINWLGLAGGIVGILVLGAAAHAVVRRRGAPASAEDWDWKID